MTADEKFRGLGSAIGTSFKYLTIYIAVLSVVFIVFVVAILLRIKKKREGKTDDENQKKFVPARVGLIVIAILLLVLALPVIFLMIGA